MQRKAVKRVLIYYYNSLELPDDDAGREDFATFCHTAYRKLPPDRVADYIERDADVMARWMTDDEVEDLIREVNAAPRRLTPEEIGQRLRLRNDVRMRPDVHAYIITPIDKLTKEQNEARCRENGRLRAARWRANKRRANPVTKTERAIDLLSHALAHGPLPVWRVLSLAAEFELQPLGTTKPSCHDRPPT